MSDGRHTERYGRKYWCIKVPTKVSPDGEIYVNANRLEVVDGNLLCFGTFKPSYDSDEEKDEQIYLALAQGQWIAFFAASVLDGAAVAVDHWKGEVLE